MSANRQWLMAAHPNGRGLLDTDFELTSKDIAKPEAGQVVAKTLYLGFDPAMKGWMENIGGYMAPMAIGDLMRGSTINQIVESKSDKFKVGDLVMGQGGWQEYATVDASHFQKVENDEFLTSNLGALGTTGLTAYFGFLRIGKPEAGDTVAISGAAGATGSMVGQIAQIAGCRVVGIAGGKEKCDWLTSDLGFDAAIDYKNDNVRAGLHDNCPGGINVFYDNVGGKILNSALGEIAVKARVVICGGISRYETGNLPAGPENYFNLIFKRATMEGFLLTDFMAEAPMARERMKRWISEGKIQFKEDIQEGFENIPTTLNRLFTGQNFGKQLLKLADPE